MDDPDLDTADRDPSCPICAAPARYDFSGRDLMFDLHQPFDYYRCTGCGLIFMHPMPDAKTIAGFYPPTYDIYEDDDKPVKSGIWKRAILRARLGYAHLDGGPLIALGALGALPETTPHWVPGGRLLDVGCGNGRFLRSMRVLGWNVQGVELSADGVRVCRKADLPVHHGDVVSAALTAESFDVITVRHVIEHIPEPRPFMRELVRVLKPGGRLIMETPNSQALGRAWLSVNWFANEIPRHLYLYHSGNLQRLAADYGLHCESLRLSTSPKILLNSLDYILENHGRPSKYIRWRRLLARAYVWLAQRSCRGDIVHACFVKPLDGQR